MLRTLVLALTTVVTVAEKFSQDWFKAQNDISALTRQKYTNKEIKKDYR